MAIIPAIHPIQKIPKSIYYDQDNKMVEPKPAGEHPCTAVLDSSDKIFTFRKIPLVADLNSNLIKSEKSNLQAICHDAVRRTYYEIDFSHGH